MLGTASEPAMRALADGFCRAHLGSGAEDVLFASASTGVAFGLRLEDGRRVVVKAFQPAAAADTLRAVQRVQAHLHREGFPCPAPLAGPAPLGRGLGLAETLLDAGEARDTHDPACRRAMAGALAWHLELARPCGRPEALRGWNVFSAGGLWPPAAHSALVDLDAPGGAWLDEIAARATAQAGSAGPEALGHHDWSGEHFRFAGGSVTAVYDWDSVQLSHEAVIVGNAAMTFTANHELPDVPLVPTPDEVRAFVDEYGEARGRPLDRRERTRIAGCATYIAAYIARCELSAGGRDDFATALRTHRDAYLRP